MLVCRRAGKGFDSPLYRNAQNVYTRTDTAHNASPRIGRRTRVGEGPSALRSRVLQSITTKKEAAGEGSGGFFALNR